jgi:hypothetical protein
VNTITSKLIVTLGVGVAMAVPSTAFARHGADDGVAHSGDNAAEVETHNEVETHTGVVDDNGAQSGAENQSETHSHSGSRTPATVRTESYNLRGSVASVDAASNTVVITVKKANHGRRGRALVGQSITLDLSGARLQLADANGDGTVDVNDVSAGDRVEARVQLPRGGSAPVDPVGAQRFKDRDARSSDDAADNA